MLFNSGITHVSGDLHKGVWERYQAGEENVSQALDDIRRAGLNMSEAITNESKSEFIGALRLVMQSVDLLSMELHDPFRQNLNQFVQNGEVLAWKAMGAGSGGVVGILISEDCNRSILIDKLNSMGWTNLDWKIDEEGLCREEITL